MPTSGDFPLSVSVRPLFIGPKGGGTYEIALTDNAPRSVPRACLTIIQQTHGLASKSRPTPTITNGDVRGPSNLKKITSADGPSYEALVRAPQVGRQINFRIVAIPATVQNPGLTCVLVGALVPQANPSSAIDNGTVQDSSQMVCTFPRKKPPALLPIQLSLGGPSQTHTGSVSEYTVTVRNLSARPLHDIGIGVNQPDLPKFPAIAVETDYGLKRGRQLRKEVQVKTLGSSPITFHLWWRARGPQRTTNGESLNVTTFGVAAYDQRTYPNPSEIIYAALLSPITTQVTFPSTGAGEHSPPSHVLLNTLRQPMRSIVEAAWGPVGVFIAVLILAGLTSGAWAPILASAEVAVGVVGLYLGIAWWTDRRTAQSRDPDRAN